MSDRNDRKSPPTDERLMGGQNMSMAGAPIPTEHYRGGAERAEEAEDREGKNPKVKVSEQPGPEYREAAPKEPEEEHRFTTESQRWGPPGTSREERGYPREGEEPERRASDEPPERMINPRK